VESLRKSGLTKLVFIFLPGHPGVKGNERADRLAESAIVGDGQAMDRADILNAIRDARREADSFGETKGTSN
jgi:ribonuclease HI